MSDNKEYFHVDIDADGPDPTMADISINGVQMAVCSLDLRMNCDELITANVQLHSNSLDIRGAHGTLYTEIGGQECVIIPEVKFQSMKDELDRLRRHQYLSHRNKWG